MSTPKSCPKKSSLSRYFADLDDSDLSEDSDNDSGNSPNIVPAVPTSNIKVLSKSRPENKNVEKSASNNGSKLPSANECLSSDKRPDYLRLNSGKEINWDQIELRLPSDETGNPSVTDYKNNSVPPPTSYESLTDQGNKVVDADGNKRKRIGTF